MFGDTSGSHNLNKMLYSTSKRQYNTLRHKSQYIISKKVNTPDFVTRSQFNRVDFVIKEKGTPFTVCLNHIGFPPNRTEWLLFLYGAIHDLFCLFRVATSYFINRVLLSRTRWFSFYVVYRQYYIRWWVYQDIKVTIQSEMKKFCCGEGLPK